MSYFRRVGQSLLAHVRLCRSLSGTPFSIEFPAGQYLSLVRPSGMRYEPELRQAFHTSLEPGDIAVDIGANIGLHTLFMRSLVGESGRVVAFEPDPQASYFLLRNVLRNELSNIFISTAALSDSSSVAPLHLDLATGRTTSLRSEIRAPKDPSAGRPAVSVPTLRFDDAVEDLGRINLIKIDVEGAEVEVLRGAAETIARFRPVLVVEVKHSNLDLVDQLLRPLGYVIKDAMTQSPVELSGYSGNIVARPESMSAGI